MKAKSLILSTLACAMAVHAGPRSSANYSVATDTADAGGTRSTSAAYTHDGSLGGVVGVSTVATPAETAKYGYLGQLYEITGLAVNATPASVNEEATRQLAAWQELDDDSYLAVNATEVAWSIVTGPLSDIDAGLATADTVYENTSARVQGAYADLSDSFDLTVLNTLPDNYPGYASDGLDDDWQVQYFNAPPNTNAGPLMDPDGDGQNNRFEFTAGIDPTDPFSRFLLRVEPVDGEPSKKRLIFSPRFNDRNYDILTSTTLLGDSWLSLTNGIVSDAGEERSVIDPEATQNQKFYRVGISKP